MAERKSYGRKLLLALDRFGAVLLFDCPEHVTISSYVGKNYHGKWPEKLIDWIFRISTGEVDHCMNNIEKEFWGE